MGWMRRRACDGRSLLVIGLCAVAVAGLVTGCSSDDSAKSSTGHTTTSSAAQSGSSTTAGGSSAPTTAGPKAADIKNPSEVSTSTIPKASQVPFDRSACQALTDAEVVAAPWATLKNVKVLRSGVDDAGAACGWQIQGDGGTNYTLRVAFVPRDQFDGDVAAATPGQLQKLDIGDESYLLPAAANVTPPTNSVWVRVGNKVAEIDGESVASAEQLASIVAARLK